MPSNDLPAAFVVHRIDGRIRLRIPEMHKQHAYFSRVRSRLAELGGVRRVTTDARTASVLIEHSAELGDVNQIGAESGLFRVESRPAIVPLGQHMRNAATRADHALRQASGGRADVEGITALALAGLGLEQIAAGEVLPASLTLFWHAVSALRNGEGGGG